MRILPILTIFLLPSLSLAQHLVLLGGNLKDDNANVWNQMVQLAGGIGVAEIGVLSASQTITVESARVASNFVDLYGARNATCIPLKNADDPAIAALVRRQTGVFIVEDSGVSAKLGFLDLMKAMFTNQTGLYETPDGAVAYESPSQDRLHLIQTLRPSGSDSQVMMAIKEVLDKGGMVAGNCGMMSQSPIIISGDSLGALVNGTSFLTWPKVPPVYSIMGGLGLVKGFLLDSELSERGREMRLIRALLDTKSSPNGTTKGFGIDQNAALVLSNPPTSHPVGTVITAKGATSGVFYVDVANVTTDSVVNATYDKIPFSFLTVNDTVNLATNEVKYADWKVAIAGEEWFDKAIPSNDILSRSLPSQWRDTARRLIDCKELNVTSHSPFSVIPWAPQVVVHLDRSEAVGYGADLPGDANRTYVASYSRMLASIKVVPGIL